MLLDIWGNVESIWELTFVIVVNYLPVYEQDIFDALKAFES